ncbi:hypothetical protein K493DRAFT_223771 [Basidiobolus meristosporus CBS 931.73]|uniref:chitin synthase n=1 Tax=Basidiobolus meristosporus CBS 931.73 TaxID=1314790 RepID=A0A1Y1Y594_9FUNG|nr:hypothetical protein K493DRAFT_223771 [Basidiobolus meristosporus CBS 931.73]|eukprot:ORX93190.1 hypothetical protein K493DRAFT_223771 [Basidiobolus meristosporus CBS 931.73]
MKESNGFDPRVLEQQSSEGFPRRRKSLIRPERHPVDRRYPRRISEVEASDTANRSRNSKHPALDRNGASFRSLKGGKLKETSVFYKRGTCPSAWQMFATCATFYAPNPVLSCCGMKTKEIRQAWREKMALCTVIILLCLAVGFLTFGFQQVLCGFSSSINRVKHGSLQETDAIINGKAFSLADYTHPPASNVPQDGKLVPIAGGQDISFMFQNVNGNCKGVLNVQSGADGNGNVVNYFPCVVRNSTTPANPSDNPDHTGCHRNPAARAAAQKLKFVGEIYYEWPDILKRDRNLVVYNGHVLDFDLLKWLVPGIQAPALFADFLDAKSPYRGTDVTFFMGNYHRAEAKCAMDILRVGALDTTSMGCIISNVVLYVSLIVILGVVLAKFFLAVFFGWVISWRLGTFREETYEERMQRLEAIEQWSENPNRLAVSANMRESSNFLPNISRYSTPPPVYDVKRSYQVNYGAARLANNSSNSLLPPNPMHGRHVLGRYNTPPESPGPYSRRSSRSSATFGSNLHVPPVPPPPTFQPFNFQLAHTILLVTCYSEGEQGMRTTLDSLALTDYPESHKLILVIADGIITGSGNALSTPDICLSMMKDFALPPENVQPYSYIAIADGVKRHNMAKVFAGYYKFDNAIVPADKQPRVPMILIAKSGNSEEQNLPKPGNRGKRDSQIVLMSFLQHVMFNDRMTEMEYELFNAIWSVTGVSPDNFEIVLMVDADTKVYPDSVTRMVSCMVRDPQIMGLCGETKIANKRDSWVTMIQVFEYYISHHQSKAFESIFGGVTCLPGCFCMYRIKAPKGPNGYWVPILASPEIVEHYSENVVDTLHKKNLLLLGEDRYLTTLMLRTFPKRKMMFVPQAVCKTVVPDTFGVLLSQRRRWINSTVHNLLELVLIRDLCGTFCFSMQFVVFMELVGTVVLPAAISFTIYLVIISFFTTPVPIIPLILLAIILGLPAILILMTTRKIVYVGWMLVYLLSLVLWNFVLPTYAFWHFDDFSWGQTRQVEGEAKGGHHGEKEGEFDGSRIIMKKWNEFEKEKRRKTDRVLSQCDISAESQQSLEKLGYHIPSQLARLSNINLRERENSLPTEGECEGNMPGATGGNVAHERPTTQK